MKTLCTLAGVCLLNLVSLAYVSAQPGQTAPVVTAQVLERSAVAEKTYIANVYPHRRALIGSAVDGRVETFPIESGQPVAASAVLTEIRTATIRIELAGAMAERDLRKAELEELQNGALEEEIALAEAQLDAAQASVNYTRSRLERATKLFKEGVGLSEDEFQAARSETLRAEAALQEATNQLQLVRDGPRKEKIAQATARLEMQKQIVAGIEDRIKKYTLRAPFDGYVSRELTEAGAWVRQGDPVAEVIEIDPVEVVVNVPEANVPYIQIGQSCTIQVEAFPAKIFKGEISHVVPEGDAKARSFPIKIRVPNPSTNGRHPLLPGMLARVSLPAGEAETALLVPKDALNLAGDRSTVIKVVDDKAVAVPVATGASFGGLIRIQPIEPESLKKSDVVVVRGNERLRPGQSVAVRSSIDSATLLPADR